MDLFLLHSLLLIWASLGAASRLFAHLADRLLAAALLAWGNLVATGLLLSLAGRLGDPVWFFGLSAALALGLGTLAWRQTAATAEESPAGAPNRWLLAASLLALLLLAAGSAAAAWVYEPNNPDALAWQLPRALYYLGQGNLASFAAADPRQSLAPFNHALLQVFGFVHGAPLPVQNFFNLIAWAVAGVGIYRACRLAALGANAALAAGGLALAAAPVLAQAATTTPELPVGAALLAALVFALRWQQERRRRDALLAGLAFGLAAGSDWRIAALGYAVGLPWLLWRAVRRRGEPVGIPPILLALAVSLPFAGVNLAAHSHAAGSPRWLGSLVLLRRPPPLVLLNEDNMGFGLLALLFLSCGIWCARRPRHPLRGFAWLALASILPGLVTPWSTIGPRDFIPTLLLLAPAVAAWLDVRPFSLRAPPWMAVLLLALASAWSSGIYLLGNSSRPLAPLLNGGFVPPALPPLPQLVDYHLSRHSQINVDSDGRDEAIFPLLARVRHPQFTSRQETDPRAYNLISRAAAARHSGGQDLARGQTVCAVLALPAKRTAGVEFLATIGRGAAARDYFGLEPDAGTLAATAGSQAVLLTVSRAGDAAVQIRAQGLNPGDLAHLVMEMKSGGHTSALATIPSSGQIAANLPASFDELVFRALDNATGSELGRAVIPYATPIAAAPQPVDPGLPSNPLSILATDLVRAGASIVAASDGLTPTEGPFSQWDLPYVRWARQPVVTLTVPPTAALARLQLAFSVRLHVRHEAVLEVVFNGKVVQTHRFESETTWWDATLDLTPGAGENIVEFRDVPLRHEPDWQDYLERYPDVKKYLLANKIPLERGAREHYDTAGRAEGRTMQFIEEPSVEHTSYYFMFRKLRVEGFKAP